MASEKKRCLWVAFFVVLVRSLIFPILLPSQKKTWLSKGFWIIIIHKTSLNMMNYGMNWMNHQNDGTSWHIIGIITISISPFKSSVFFHVLWIHGVFGGRHLGVICDGCHERDFVGIRANRRHVLSQSPIISGRCVWDFSIPEILWQGLIRKNTLMMVLIIGVTAFQKTSGPKKDL